MPGGGWFDAEMVSGSMIVGFARSWVLALSQSTGNEKLVSAEAQGTAGSMQGTIVLFLWLLLAVAIGGSVGSVSSGQKRRRGRRRTNGSAANNNSSLLGQETDIISNCRNTKGSFGLSQYCCVVSAGRNSSNSIPELSQFASAAAPVNTSSSHRGVVCLPSFIIAGTQKSATTILSALLAEHKHISFAPTKEIHFFDRNKYYMKGKLAYLKAFKPWIMTSKPNSTDEVNDRQTSLPIFGESTPFYLPSKHGCRRIANVVPGVKMIIMLREPIERAYSEYHMKKRRVDSQNSFIEIIKDSEADVHACMVIHRSDWDALTACLPDEMTRHSHFSKFLISLKLLLKNSNGGWSGVMAACFDRLPELSVNHEKMTLSKLEFSSKENNVFSSTVKEDHSQDIKGSAEDWPSEMDDDSITKIMLGMYVDRSGDSSLAVDNYASLLYSLRARSDYKFNSGNNVLGSPHPLLSLNSTSPFMDIGLQGKDISSSSQYSQIFPYQISGYFQPERCLGKHAREIVFSVSRAFRDEVEHLESCGGYIISRLRAAQELSGTQASMSPKEAISTVLNTSSASIQAAQKMYMSVGVNDMWPSIISPREAEVVIRKCVNITSGISQQYLYRSMYAPQISSCLRHLPRDQFLFLAAEDLRTNPRGTLRTVLRFIGFTEENDLIVPALEKDSVNTHNVVTDSLVDKVFPKFGKETGWREQGHYPKIPRAIVSRLQTFFAPLNDALYSVIDKDFDGLWGRVYGAQI